MKKRPTKKPDPRDAEIAALWRAVKVLRAEVLVSRSAMEVMWSETGDPLVLRTHDTFVEKVYIQRVVTNRTNAMVEP